MTDVHDITKAMFKTANLKRYNHAQVEEHVDNAEIIRDSAQEWLDKEPYEALDNLADACEAVDDLAHLGVIDASVIETIRTFVEEIVGLLPPQEDMQAIVEGWDNVNEAVNTVADHREDPRNYDADEKEQAREEAASLLLDFASTLDAIAPKKEDDSAND